MKKRIFWSICATALGCLLLFSVCVVALAYFEGTRSGFLNLRISDIYLADGYELEGQAYLAQLEDTPERITLIAPDGTVLFDTQEDAAAQPPLA